MSTLPWQRRWDPFREMGRFFEEIEPFAAWRPAQPFPALNIYDNGEQYVVAARMPGVRNEDLDISITGEALTLRGERKRADKVAEDAYRRQERPCGRWSRTVTLPERVETEQATASLVNGLLTINLPKAASARPRQISVTTPNV
ncbi:MAG: Hsp20/alpha crystallin family protein [Planctomycetota bacterium]|nr:Hsp20/alpha crystallin family protein [Planctomycetota bacterium]